MRLQLDRVNWSVDGKQILRDISIAVEPGSITGLIGPNGSGKSSLLRCIYRALRPDSGTITLDGDDLRSMDTREAARRIAVVLQEYPTDFQFTVGESFPWGATRTRAYSTAIPRQIGASSGTHWHEWAWPDSPSGTSTLCPEVENRGS